MKTIGWLAQEASDRFYKSEKLRPVLKLATKDGALLSPDDLVALLLTHNEEVSAMFPNRFRFSKAARGPSLKVRDRPSLTRITFSHTHSSQKI